MATTRQRPELRALRPDDVPLDWGREREMNALEALMWRAEADPRLRSTVCCLEELDSTPDWDRLFAAHEWSTRLVPRFRQRVVEPALGVGAPAWVVDPNFDLHYHARRVRLPEGAGWRELLDHAVQIAATPFDRARPLWESVLFEGLPDGRSAWLLKLHHSTADGLGFVQVLAQLHSRQREHNPDKPQPLPPRPEELTSSQALARQVADDVRAFPAFVQRGVGGALRSLAHPQRSVRDALRFGSSLQRVLGETGATGSPLLRGRSLSWRWLALDVDFASLRAASKVGEGTLNDAFLAALLGGFRRYHERLGRPIELMPIAIPVSVRKEGDAAGGNRFAGARLAAPVDIVDPVARIAAIGKIIRTARAEPALDALGFIAPALSRLPGPVISQLAGGMTKANDLQASNIPGIRDDVYLAGAKIERAYGFGPLPGCATMVTLVTHGSTCCVSVNLDPAAVTDTELFGRCLLEGFEEVLALAPDPVPPTLRT
ncbi:MAG TPA: wax ester/triacylglycerol synthase domain-containing protein [Solirubrobacteraceae bacterium]